ncbi:radical SAM protein [Desulfosediminicola flagellatus]|uniref:radical SAM protein n=1 Tax=Desulfosediminicola flagellatus TaxID=2569541 RepID=UPI0010ACE5E6|nr:radical SAM protein [Desulfosediminicola flagellatus]
MTLSVRQRDKIVATNQREFGERYQSLKFPDNHALQIAEQQRSEYLAELHGTVVTDLLGTKLDMRKLSPGCKICTEGNWSCLFISGKCNCRCFYCPTSQDEIGKPTTNSVEFDHPADYVAYLERFGFAGASISGGEPLLTLERSLAFIRAIKRRFGSGIHVWLYTNGTLATVETLSKLRDAGLDEIRFDIGAIDYNLQPLSRAVGLIPTVTVEIPAIPEEKERMKCLLSELRDTGVQHLNLHQLRLTPFNYDQLQARNYRYIHGEKITVLDSELAALEILQHGIREGIDLPINYCSFPYKNRFQGGASRRRNASFLLHGFESLTESGFIRTLTLLGKPAKLHNIISSFGKQSNAETLWKINGAKNQLTLHPSLWPLVQTDGLRLLVAHSGAYQKSSVSYRNPFSTIELSPTKNIVVERVKHHADFELNQDQAELFAAVFIMQTQSASELPQQDMWDELKGFEKTQEGLLEYF